jgi:murein L,D-transpeptidase YcbB/YkuD
MFGTGECALSPGCIHLEHPAEWRIGWCASNRNGRSNALNVPCARPDNNTVQLTKPVPIVIVHGTAIVLENGEVNFNRDVYGYDTALHAALAKGYPYPQ